MEKGTLVQPESIDMYSRLENKFFQENKEELSNSFFKGWTVDNQTVYGIRKEYKVFELDYEKALDYFNTVFAKHNMSNDF